MRLNPALPSVRCHDPDRHLSVLLALASLLVVAFTVHGLIRSDRTVASSSGARPLLFVAKMSKDGGRLCQPGITVAPGTTSIELTVGTFGRPGPELALAFDDSATRDPARATVVRRGWREGVLRVPYPSLASKKPLSGTLCLRSRDRTALSFAGEALGAPASVDGAPSEGRISVAAVHGQRQSFLERLRPLGSRLGRGNAGWIGGWTVWAVGILLGASVLLGSAAILFTEASPRALGHRVPRSVLACTAAAAAVGSAWALLTPPFQVPDETSHVAYVKYLSESGKLPVVRPGVAPYSEEERSVLAAIGFDRIIGRPLERVISTAAEERNLREVERRRFPSPDANATTASSNPPLYYLLETPIALATHRGGILNQVMAMRFLSVALLAGSVLFASLFARELMPRSPWTWTAAGLACAFQPTLGFISSGVNADSLLFCASAAFFFAVGLMCRRGPTVRGALLLGGALSVALLTKPLGLALVPVAIACFALNALRTGRRWLRPTMAGAIAVLVPVGLVAVIGTTLFDHPYFAGAQSVAAGASDTAGSANSLAKQVSFELQLFLPRLPFLADQIQGKPMVDVWINGLVGVFGWVDYGFPADVVRFATRFLVALFVLLLVALCRSRATLATHWRLMLCCVVGLASVPAVVGTLDYQAFIAGSARFEQARYLLPLLALYGGLFALAFKAFGAKLGRLLLPFLWLLVVAHTLSAFALTAERYYL